jgi:hypothetical protein
MARSAADVVRASAVTFDGESKLGLAAILLRQLHTHQAARIPGDTAFADRGIKKMMMDGLRAHARNLGPHAPQCHPICANAHIIGQ